MNHNNHPNLPSGMDTVTDPLSDPLSVLPDGAESMPAQQGFSHDSHPALPAGGPPISIPSHSLSPLLPLKFTLTLLYSSESSVSILPFDISYSLDRFLDSPSPVFENIDTAGDIENLPATPSGLHSLPSTVDPSLAVTPSPVSAHPEPLIHTEASVYAESAVHAEAATPAELAFDAELAAHARAVSRAVAAAHAETFARAEVAVHARAVAHAQVTFQAETTAFAEAVTCAEVAFHVELAARAEAVARAVAAARAATFARAEVAAHVEAVDRAQAALQAEAAPDAELSPTHTITPTQSNTNPLLSDSSHLDLSIMPESTNMENQQRAQWEDSPPSHPIVPPGGQNPSAWLEARIQASENQLLAMMATNHNDPPHHFTNDDEMSDLGLDDLDDLFQEMETGTKAAKKQKPAGTERLSKRVKKSNTSTTAAAPAASSTHMLRSSTTQKTAESTAKATKGL
ncbi:uncharacterized protein N7511_007117 [Penicillium nucicola]|uniref:uncharacterized protein n=1 Tax=Penicillium nucicola TaxID=1850975 RepID=UPI002545AE8A|nr:uncharacterized protein N7511_007117 [Penicillium nucicola]KAJ5756935.1 hypothetical protein N7511_007117 [Penicillium nucicola]